MDDRIVWIYLAVAALATGAVVAATLILPRKQQYLTFTASILSLTALAYNIRWALAVSPSASASLYASTIVVVGAIAGYTLISGLVMGAASAPIKEREVRHPPAPGRGRSVMIAALAEPPEYSALDTARALAHADAAGAATVGLGVLPYLLLLQRLRYEAAGGSPTVAALRQLTEMINDDVRRPEGVTVSYTTRRPGIAGRELSEWIDGFGDTDSLLIDLDGFVHADQVEGADTNLRTLSPQHVAELLVEAAVPSILSIAQTGSGIVLCSLLDDRASMDAESEREQRIAEEVSQRLVSAGISKDLIRLARLRDAGSGVANAVRHLATAGCTDIVVHAPAHPLGSLATTYDLVIAVARARLDRGVATTVLHPEHTVPHLAHAVVRELTAPNR